MSTRLHLTQLILSLLILAWMTAFSPSKSGKSQTLSALPGTDAQARPADPSADLSLSTQDNLIEPEGSQITLRLLVSNAGPDVAESLSLFVPSYDQILTFLDADAPGWTCTGTATGATCERPGLGAGESSEVVLRFLVTPPPDPDSSFSLIWVYLSAATPDPTPNPALHFWIFVSGKNTIDYLPLVDR